MLPLTGAYDFVDRLVRQLKERRHWASRNRVSCFRIYDREDAGFPFLIDLYEDRLVWSVLSEREEDDVSEELVELASEATGIARAKIHVKSRQKQRGKDQYEKVDETKQTITVREGGLKFLVNLSDYLDTGLFLDHRWTRAYVRDLAGGLKVLNLVRLHREFYGLCGPRGSLRDDHHRLEPELSRLGQRQPRIERVSRAGGTGF